MSTAMKAEGVGPNATAGSGIVITQAAMAMICLPIALPAPEAA